MEEDYAQMGIHAALCNIMLEVGAIGKDRQNKQQGFMFRGIDQVYNALHPLFAKYGIVTIPKVLEMKREERVTKHGTAITHTLLTVQYQFICGADGSAITVGPVVGEGMDTGDKSVSKALAIAHKYALFQLFLIPTEKTDDPDFESIEDLTPSTEPVKPKTAPPPPSESDFWASDVPPVAPRNAPDAPAEPSFAAAESDEGADDIVDLIISMAKQSCTSRETLREFWRNNLKSLHYLEENHPQHYEKVVAVFTDIAHQFEQE